MSIINFKDLEQTDLFEKKGTVSLEIKGKVINIPIKIKNIETSIMEIDVSPDRAKLKTIVKSFKTLDAQYRTAIEQLDGFDPTQRNQYVIIYDITDEQTAREIKHSALKSKVLEVVKEFDMDYKGINSKGEETDLWTLWGIEKGNYGSLCEKFMRMGVDDVLIDEISYQIAKIKNGTMLPDIKSEIDEEDKKEEKSPSKRRKKQDSESERVELMP